MRALFTSYIRKAHSKRSPLGNRPCKTLVSHGRLIVQCQGCSGKQDLTDHECLNGVIMAMATDPTSTEEVILSRSWEVRYDHHCAQALGSLAEVVRFLRGISFEPRFEECTGCSRNPRAIVERAISTLPGIDVEASERGPAPTGEHRAACEQCARSMSNNLAHARALLSSTNAVVNRVAYRVVSGDGA